MEDQGSVHAEQFDKRGGKKGIGERFGIKQFPLTGFLQKNPQRSGGKYLVITNQIPFGVFKIPILSETLGHGIVYRLVVEEKALMDGWEIDETGESQEKAEYQKQGGIAGIFR
jgi:hypothetical protein